MKYKITTLVILVAYFAFSIATTKKDLALPSCFVQSNTQTYLYNTGANKYRGVTYMRDTLMITYSDTIGIDIATITDSMCRVGKQKCNMQSLKIVIKDTTYDLSQVNSPYGKIIFTKECR